MTPGFWDFSFFLSNTFDYEPILLKLSLNANIVKMQIFQQIKLLIDWRNKCHWTLWKNKVWLIQRRHLPCFNLNLGSYGQLFVLVLFVILYIRMLRGRSSWSKVVKGRSSLRIYSANNISCKHYSCQNNYQYRHLVSIFLFFLKSEIKRERKSKSDTITD